MIINKKKLNTYKIEHPHMPGQQVCVWSMVMIFNFVLFLIKMQNFRGYPEILTKWKY